jgi:membrane protein DedA with SNARE-associated domain
LGGLTLFLPVPILPILFTAGGAMNPVLAALIASAGMTAGMMATYAVGAGASGLTRRLTTRQGGRLTSLMTKAAGWFSREGVKASFILSLVPNPVYDFAGLIAGSVGVPWHKFAAGTFLGKSLQSLGVAVAGALAAGPMPW